MTADADRIEACARSPFKNVRMYALEKIAADGHPRATELVLRLLDDAEPAVQQEAARVAGVLQCRESVPALVELLNSAEEPVALQAAVSLGELGHYGELAPEPDLPADSSAPPADSSTKRMSTATFYLLFLILSAGLFLSGYLFHTEMQAAAPDAELAPARR